MLIDKADAAYPGKFTFTMNDNEILKKTVPEGQGWAIENQAEKPIPNGGKRLVEKRRFRGFEIRHERVVVLEERDWESFGGRKTGRCAGCVHRDEDEGCLT
jgi:hypothetical protein